MGGWGRESGRALRAAQSRGGGGCSPGRRPRRRPPAPPHLDQLGDRPRRRRAQLPHLRGAERPASTRASGTGARADAGRGGKVRDPARAWERGEGARATRRLPSLPHPNTPRRPQGRRPATSPSGRAPPPPPPSSPTAARGHS